DGLWEPTSSANPIPLQPYWGAVRPFMKKNVDDLLPVPPPAYSTDINSDFYKEAKEVYETVTNLTPEQKVIAEFWSDDPGNTATPPGHSYSIMMQILDDREYDLAVTAEVYAKLGMGVHDAFVSCWNAKYHYNLVRPITYIHKNIDHSWSIPLATPPFPEYTSGHSVQSGATAQILTDLFGDNYYFVDRTHINRTDIDGSPRSYNSFYDFANEAAISRLYGGIHYRAAIEVGVEQGIKIGENIGTLEFK
ncbi:MAG: vanadium-dependent haloperoxidase, partial [Bacteroidia bacterium]